MRIINSTLLAAVMAFSATFTCGSVNAATNGPSPVSAVDTSYVLALNAADECLTAWMHHDAKAGIATVTGRLKKNSSNIDLYFSGLSNPHNESFEVTFDKRVGNNIFWFNVWQYMYYLNYDIKTFKRTGPSHMEVIRVMMRGQTRWLVNTLPTPEYAGTFGHSFQ